MHPLSKQNQGTVKKPSCVHPSKGETMHSVIDEIHNAFHTHGSSQYGNESVTQLQHALQCGQCAIDTQSSAQLVTAALLHDIGHILSDEKMPTSTDQNLDDKHEDKGYQFLLRHFGTEVADPVRLHVVAKRYLCTKDPDYQKKLSPTSLKSFFDQGGPMSYEEQKQFESEKHFENAVRLRQWDDIAKDCQATTMELSAFEPYIKSSLISE
jgi:[1-hydroxy-2-(trimethylamino)ethyl]phosphonate dioxygenase